MRAKTRVVSEEHFRVEVQTRTDVWKWINSGGTWFPSPGRSKLPHPHHLPLSWEEETRGTVEKRPTDHTRNDFPVPQTSFRRDFRCLKELSTLIVQDLIWSDLISHYGGRVREGGGEWGPGTGSVTPGDHQCLLTSTGPRVWLKKKDDSTNKSESLRRTVGGNLLREYFSSTGRKGTNRPT